MIAMVMIAGILAVALFAVGAVALWDALRRDDMLFGMATALLFTAALACGLHAAGVMRMPLTFVG